MVEFSRPLFTVPTLPTTPTFSDWTFEPPPSTGSPEPSPTPEPEPTPTPEAPPPTGSPEAPPPSGGSGPAAATVGSGPDSLALRISQDAYQGSAQYTVSVDGVQIGGTLSASALHSSGQSDTVTVRGDWAAGNHTVTVEFLNDAYGGSAATDRNLYVDGATYNGAALAVDLDLFSAGPATFGFTEGGGSTTPPPPSTGSPKPPASTEFSTQLLWGDEFNGAALDGSKWPVVFGGGQLYWNGAFRWDRDEVSVSDGSLHIGLSKQADGIWDVGGLGSFPSSWAPGFSDSYGKLDIRAKASEEVTGAGPCFLLWPASNDKWPPEVDILETPNRNGMFTNHWQGPGGNGDNQYESYVFDVDFSQWHTYSLEWTPDRLTLNVDGFHIHTFSNNIPTEPMAVGLQGFVASADESWYGGSPNGSGVNHVDIAVDYVRYYDFIG